MDAVFNLALGDLAAVDRSARILRCPVSTQTITGFD
jgi:hypothetical protein